MTAHRYVDADTAFSAGLTFWTSSGVPGIQVSNPCWISLVPSVTSTIHRHVNESNHHCLKSKIHCVLRTLQHLN